MLLNISEPGASHAPHEKTMAVGIDLGTTNSIVAVSDNGVHQVIRDNKERSLLPSVVAYKKSGEIVVGNSAEACIGKESAIVFRSIKRFMGKGREGIEAKELPEMVEGLGMVRFNVWGKQISPIEVSAEILKTLKQRAHQALEKDVTQAVITVPAYFDDAARQATKDAAKLAGLEVLRLISEPTAAALAYGLDTGAEGIYAVYDLGGGTFDISLLKMEKGVFRVLATGGDTALGGDDFDRAIAEHLQKKILGEVTRSDYPSLLLASRKLKELLTTQESAEAKYNSQNISLKRGELEELIRSLVAGTIQIAKRVLHDANITPKEVRGVVMVGGSTRVPLVQKMVGEFFTTKPLNDLDPDKVVAIGAAIQAEALTRGSNNLLLDVTPLSLGLETMGGLVEVIIPRNTPIPVAKSQEFTTYQDNQTGMKIHVLQGEREMVNLCRSLASFELTGIPPMTAGVPRIEVVFMLDADGVLTVSAREKITGTEQHIEVKPSYGLAEGEVENMLIESMKNAKQDIQARILAEAKLEANLLLQAVESALKRDGNLLDQKAQSIIKDSVTKLKLAVSNSDRDAIDVRMEQLNRACDDFAEKRFNKSIAALLVKESISEVEQKLISQ